MTRYQILERLRMAGAAGVLPIEVLQAALERRGVRHAVYLLTDELQKLMEEVLEEDVARITPV